MIQITVNDHAAIMDTLKEKENRQEDNIFRRNLLYNTD